MPGVCVIVAYRPKSGKGDELLELVRGRFSVIAYEARLISEPAMAMVQRIAARRL